jgi:serine/threonine protein kinase
MTTGVQTLWYRAPELILSDQLYSFGVDVWAAGCIFFELLTGRIMFQSTCEIGLLFKIFQLLGTPSSATWDGVTGLPNYSSKFPKFVPKEFENAFPEIEDIKGLNLLSKMICLNPAKRISVLDCLQHPYFSGMDTLYYN